ncbi:hypothetical protein L3Q82_007209 [Scortum barcoo]|uniref:Uncharacterized protein n=1 Tax=Scortum barcoo TaxID=214431 RepID=A0ACB8WSF7_9TELE|nr:hypothetical protein L3Q82_007209 [Scortum barcoo]
MTATASGVCGSHSYCRVVCICRLACPEWREGAVEPIIAMGFVRSKRSVAVVDVYGELDVCQRKLRHNLKKFGYIYEGVAQHGNQTLLNKVYTELYITEGVGGSVNDEHENLLEPQETTTVKEAPSEMTDVLKSAVDKALQSENGHLDLFLRFLLGLSQTSNQSLLKSTLTTVRTCSPRNEEIIEHIKEKISQNPSAERCINLFHCLGELNDQSLLEEIQNYLSSGNLSETKLSPSQWSALVYVLLTSQEELEEFDLRNYSRSEEGLLRLLPVIKESRVALLKECNLTEKSCELLGDVLSDSCLKELDLSDNDLHDTGVELLSAGLASPTCELEKLRLLFCGITETGCDFLAKALRSNPTHLKELDLSYNHLGKRGMELLSCVQKEIEHLTVRLGGNAECYLKSALKKYVYGELDVCQRKLRHNLKKFGYIYEGVAQHGNQTLLNKVYTELYITEGVGGSVNDEHEPLLGEDRFIRTVLTKGISGIGKTISVHKFNLEWAEGRVNQDIQLLINLPFRELNLMKERSYTLTQLLHHFLQEAKESAISDFGKYKLVLIFDGLDECRLPLDFDHNEPCCSVSEPASVDVLLTNLIKGNLLPSAHIWITSRPAAANRIPADLVDRVTEIRGFNNPQKEEYFRKKILIKTWLIK